MEGLLGLITSLLAIASGLIPFLIRLRKDVQEIHVMVNSRMEEALAHLDIALSRIDQLDHALREADIDVPDKPNGT